MVCVLDCNTYNSSPTETRTRLATVTKLRLWRFFLEPEEQNHDRSGGGDADDADDDGWYGLLVVVVMMILLLSDEGLKIYNGRVFVENACFQKQWN